MNRRDFFHRSSGRDFLCRDDRPIRSTKELLADAVFNYLGILTAEEFIEWYNGVRELIERSRDEGEEWKR